MASQLPIQGPNGPKQTAPIQSTSAAPTPQSAANAVAFRALLDGLEAKARELDAQTKAVAKPEDLAGAVQGAKASLDDALSIRDRLLEAYRQAQAQSAPNAEPPKAI